MTSKCYIGVTIEKLNGGPMEKVATTFRLDPVVKEGLSMLSTLLGRSLNNLVDEAIRDFVARRTMEVENDLEASLEDLRAYRKSDPDFEQAIAGFVDAEMTVKNDPAEGRVIKQTGPAETEMLKILNG